VHGPPVPSSSEHQTRSALSAVHANFAVSDVVVAGGADTRARPRDPASDDRGIDRVESVGARLGTGIPDVHDTLTDFVTRLFHAETAKLWRPA
jgi:hypothetical protein